MEEVDPHFVMATLICFLDAQHAERDREGSMHADLPSTSENSGFKNPHTSDHSPGTPPDHHKGVGASEGILNNTVEDRCLIGGAMRLH